MNYKYLLLIIFITITSTHARANDFFEDFNQKCPDEKSRKLIPSIGMSEEKFTCTNFFYYGTMKINTHENKNGYMRQYVFKDGWGIKYVYVRNGKISSISRSN